MSEIEEAASLNSHGGSRNGDGHNGRHASRSPTRWSNSKDSRRSGGGCSPGTGLAIILVSLFTNWQINSNFFSSSHQLLSVSVSNPLLTSPGLVPTTTTLESISDSSGAQIQRVVTNSTTRPSDTVVNILFGMQGNRKAFIDEWEVCLKSILLNAPLDGRLHVHIVADAAAEKAIQARIDEAKISGTMWRNQIQITVYNVEDLKVKWTNFIIKKIRGQTMDRRVTLGGYYRLLAYQVLPKGTGPTFYIDTDSVFLTNLNEFAEIVDPTKVVQLRLTWVCSGFFMMNMDKFSVFWELLDKLPEIGHGGDQSLLADVLKANPDIVGDMDIEWDSHMGNGFKMGSHNILWRRPKGVNYMHFNGQRFGDQTYWTKGLYETFCMGRCGNKPHHADMFKSTWGLVEYYINIRWPWLIYQGETSIGVGHTGHPLEFKVVKVSSDDVQLP